MKSDVDQPPEGKPEVKLSKAGGVILRTLYDPQEQLGYTSSLKHGLHSAASALVRRGWIWKQDRGFARPLYGLKPEGIPAAEQAWKDAFPHLKLPPLTQPPQLPHPPQQAQLQKEWGIKAIETLLLTKTSEGLGNYTETVSYKLAKGDLTREQTAHIVGAPLAIIPIVGGWIPINS